MERAVRAVVDANVFISALLTPSGTARQLITYLEQSLFVTFYPELLIQELREAPSKRGLVKRLTNEQVERLIGSIEKYATFVELLNIPAVCRDPDDDAYLACAAISQSDYLVSRDPDLLDLREHGQTKIINPEQFREILERRAGA